MPKRKSIGNSLRMKILVRDGFKCKYCGNNVDGGAILQVDHVVPVAKGGTNDEYNLVTSCRDCNMGKFDKSIVELESIRLDSAKSQLENLNKIMESKKELENVAYEIIKQKSTESVSPETMAVLKYIEENGIDFNKSSFKKMEALIKSEGFEIVIEAIDRCKSKSKLSIGYLSGVIGNIRLEKEFPEGYESYKNYYYNVILKLNLAVPLKKETISRIVKIKAVEQSKDFDWGPLVHDIIIFYRYMKKNRMYDLIDVILIEIYRLYIFIRNKSGKTQAEENLFQGESSMVFQFQKIVFSRWGLLDHIHYCDEEYNELDYRCRIEEELLQLDHIGEYQSLIYEREKGGKTFYFCRNWFPEKTYNN